MTHDHRQPAPLSPVEKFNKLSNIFGTYPLARLLRSRATSLYIFADGEAPLGPRYTERLDLLHGVVRDLESTHNAHGINRWFDRRHKALAHQTPREIMYAQPWRAQQREIRQICKIASSTAAKPAL